MNETSEDIKPFQVENRVMDALTELFRSHGYQGTSLSQIVSATGLVKASLYHRFKGGKEQMALAAIDRVADLFSSYILAPLAVEGDPSAQLAKTTQRLKEFYDSGAKACLLETMSLTGNSAIRERAKKALEYWIDTFAAFARANEIPGAIARIRAEEAVMSIEGALVLTRLSSNRQIFHRVLRSLSERLMKH